VFDTSHVLEAEDVQIREDLTMKYHLLLWRIIELRNVEEN